MTREEAFAEINQIQNDYVLELIRLIYDPSYAANKFLNFTSPTGTGKTKMMSKLINQMPDAFFVVTTLSRGQLNLQIIKALEADCQYDNYVVYGSCDYRVNSKLTAEDILSMIPADRKAFWLRDEGHIHTNRFDELLEERCEKIINFSATNRENDIQCNFTQTMMLRTVHQTTGTPEDAIQRLLDVKKIHKNVAGYNPCAIFRCITGKSEIYNRIIIACKNAGLKYIDITDETFVMDELCQDDNEYDVIINKMKIVEGIDIRRAHVLYMDNQPNNNSTTIQVIGRCRRNALLYRNDVDILDPSNADLLRETRCCYVYYNVENMKMPVDENGELQIAFCDRISCEALKVGSTIEVVDGQLSNGLYVIELESKTGKYTVERDSVTGFNVINPITDFYDVRTQIYPHTSLSGDNDIDSQNTARYGNKYIYFEKPYWGDYHKVNVRNLNLSLAANAHLDKQLDGSYQIISDKPFFSFTDCGYQRDVPISITKKALNTVEMFASQYTETYILSKIHNHCIDLLMDDADYDISKMKDEVDAFIKERETVCPKMCEALMSISDENSLSRVFLRSSFWEPGLSSQLIKISCSKNVIILLQYYSIQHFLQGTSLNTSSYVDYTIRRGKKAISKIATNHNDLFCDQKTMCDYLYIVFSQDIDRLEHWFIDYAEPLFSPSSTKISVKDIHAYEHTIQNIIDGSKIQGRYYLNGRFIAHNLSNNIERLYQQLSNGTISCVKTNHSSLLEPTTELETLCLHYHCLKANISHTVPLSKINTMTSTMPGSYKPYIKTVNDNVSAVIGTDIMMPIKTDKGMIFVESKAVTAKVTGNSKLRRFLHNTYTFEIANARIHCFGGKNNYSFNARCNSMLGYCVEYYSKYLVYGSSYLIGYIDKVADKEKVDTKDIGTIIRACVLKYKSLMENCYGAGAARLIQCTSAANLNTDEYKSFTDTVVALGAKTAAFVKQTLYPKTKTPMPDIDPNLSVEHICGMADFITEDTILDVKVQNHITETNILQVLAYHYLSTKRSDLHIRQVIVYDATSGKAIVIPITRKNQT